MLYNKNRFQKANDKKVLHKVKKQWVTISLAILMAIGGGAAATQVNASANNSTNLNVSSQIHDTNQQGDNYSPDVIQTNASSQSNVKTGSPNPKKTLGGVPNNSNVTKVNQINNLSSSASSYVTQAQLDKSSAGNELNNLNNSNSHLRDLWNSASNAYSNTAANSQLSNDVNSANASLTTAQNANGSIINIFSSVSTSSASNVSSYVSDASQAVSGSNSVAYSNDSSLANVIVQSMGSSISSINASMSQINSVSLVFSSLNANANSIVNVLSAYSGVSSNASQVSKNASSTNSVISGINSTSDAASQDFSEIEQWRRNASSASVSNSGLNADQASVSSLNQEISTLFNSGSLDNSAASSAVSDADRWESNASYDMTNNFDLVSFDISQVTSDVSLTSSALSTVTSFSTEVQSDLSSISQSASDAKNISDGVNNIVASQKDVNNDVKQVDSYYQQISNNQASINSYSNDHSSIVNEDQLIHSVSSQIKSASLDNVNLDLAISNADIDRSSADDDNSAVSTALSFTNAELSYASGVLKNARQHPSLAAPNVRLASEAVSETNSFISSVSIDGSAIQSMSNQCFNDASVANSVLTSLNNGSALDSNSLSALGDINKIANLASQDSAVVDSAQSTVSNDITSASSARQALNSFSTSASSLSDASASAALYSLSNDANSNGVYSSLQSDQRVINSAMPSTASLVNKYVYYAREAAFAANNNIRHGNGSNDSPDVAIATSMEQKAASVASQILSEISQANSITNRYARDASQAAELVGRLQQPLDPNEIDANTIQNAVTQMPAGDFPAIISLNQDINGHEQPIRYVINVHPGEQIRLSNGQVVPLYCGNDHILHAGSSNGPTTFDDANPLPNSGNQFTVNPRMQFYYDDGDGHYSQVSNNADLGFHVDQNGYIVNPQTVSGHYDEPHDIDLTAITGCDQDDAGNPTSSPEYPHFSPDLDPNSPLNQNDQKQMLFSLVKNSTGQERHVMDVVFGKGLSSQPNSPENDNGSYWLDNNWTVKMVARRYHAQIRYYYKDASNPLPLSGDAANLANNVEGFPNQSVDVYQAFDQAQKEGQINSNWEIAPNQQAILNDANSSEKHPQTINIQLQPSSNVNLKVPVILKDFADQNNPIAMVYPTLANLWGASYNKIYPYDIQRGTLDTPVLNAQQRNFLQTRYGVSDSPLDGNFIVSNGQLNTQSLINGPKETSQWCYLPQNSDNPDKSNDIHYYYQGLADYPKLSQNHDLKVANVGYYTLTSDDVQNLKTNLRDSGYDQNNLPYAGEVVPIIYFSQFKGANQNADLIRVPSVKYNYRYWEPLDHQKDSDYDHYFVNSNAISFGDDEYNNNSDIGNDSSLLNSWSNTNLVNDQVHNAHNFYTVQNNLSNLAGDYAPNDLIVDATQLPNARSGFRTESGPNSNWFVEFTKDTNNSQQVDLKLIKQDQNQNLLTDNNTAIKYLGNAGQNPAGVQEVPQSTSDHSYPIISVTYGNQTEQYPKNAAILVDNGKLCGYNSQGGYYTYPGSDTKIIFETNPDQHAPIQQNGTYYLGDMNEYAQPMNYSIQFLESGNAYQDKFDQNGNVVKDKNGQPEQEISNTNLYPRSDSDNNAQNPNYNTKPYLVNSSSMTNPSLRAYANDRIVFVPGKDGSGQFKLVHDGDGQSFSIGSGYPEYIPALKSQDPNVAKRLSNSHQLVYDPGYETSYLNAMSTDQQRNDGSSNQPTWVLGFDNLGNNLYQDSNSDNNNYKVAQVYLAKKSQQVWNRIHFMNMDTGTENTVKYDNSQDSNDIIKSLFYKDLSDGSGEHFDLADLLNHIEVKNGQSDWQTEKDSTYLPDGTWQLTLPIGNDKEREYWLVRTDAPGEPDGNRTNNTYIYLATEDYNDKKNAGNKTLSLWIHYVLPDGTPVDNQQKDFPVNGLLKAMTVNEALHNNGMSQSNVINNVEQRLKDDGISDSDANKQKNYPGTLSTDINNAKNLVNNGHFWNYVQDHYHEIGIVPGAYQPDYADSKYNTNLNHDVDNPIFNDPSIFGSQHAITIVLDKDSQFQLHFHDENSSADQSTDHGTRASVFNSLTPSVSNDWGYTSSTVMSGNQSENGSSLSAALNSLSAEGYYLDYYTDNDDNHSSAATISAFENNPYNFEYHNQKIDLYLKYAQQSSAQPGTVTEKIRYIKHANDSSSNEFSNYVYQIHESRERYDDVADHNRITYGPWQVISGSFSNEPSPSEAGYSADFSSVASAAASSASLGSANSTSSEFDSTINYYPTTESKTDSEEIIYYLNGKASSSYNYQIGSSRSLSGWTSSHLPIYTSWSSSSNDSFNNKDTPSIAGYYADKSMVVKPTVSPSDKNENFSYQVNYYPNGSWGPIIPPKKPNQSGRPTNPITPKPDPKQPVKPNQPINPAKPNRPVNPSQPSKPTSPDQPVKPNQPSRPISPVKPNQPSKPTNPVKPDHPIKPDQPNQTNEPNRPTNPVKPDQPSKPATPAKPQPNQPSRPTNPINPVNPKPARPSQPSKPVTPQPTTPTNPVGPLSSNNNASNNSGHQSHGSSVAHNSANANHNSDDNNDLNLFNNSADAKHSANSKPARHVNDARHDSSNLPDANQHRHGQHQIAKHNDQKPNWTSAKRVQQSKHTSRLSPDQNRRHSVAKRSHSAKQRHLTQHRTDIKSDRQRAAKQNRKLNRHVNMRQHQQTRRSRHSIWNKARQVIHWRIARHSSRTDRRTQTGHRYGSRILSDSNRLQKMIRHEAKMLGMSSSKLEQLRKTNYRRYRQLLEAHAAALFNHESDNQSRRSGRQYVHGIDDARQGKSFHNYSRDYAAGYNAFQQVTDRRTGRNDHSQNGKLPQTGDGSQMTLAAAVIMILSFFLGTSAATDKRRKH